MALPKKIFGKHDSLISLITPALVYGTIASILLYIMMPYVKDAKNGSLIMLGLFALWRYSWLILNLTRAFLYAKVAYPKLKKKIQNLPEDTKYPHHIYFSVSSYKEKDWVSVETFKSIMNELSRIPSSATIIVSTSGNPQEDAVIYDTCKAHYAFGKVELVFQHQKEGKHIGIGDSIRAIAQCYHKKDRDYNSVTFFMDGDSCLEKGFFEKLLPHFAIDSKLGAVTTNEAAFIRTNSNWYKDWFNLKFGQRHTLFQSYSLSQKVLSLTGKLSAYRTDIIVKEAFMNGKSRFLMGDDKTTWFALLEAGWNMRYLPDALCYSLESRDADFLDLSCHLPYRWYGNRVRNLNCVLALGPKRIKSFFIWWAILDQRIAMWTSLVGIISTAILGVTQAYFYFLFYVVWVLYVRIFQISVIAYNGHPVSMRSIPLILYAQWWGSFVKIKALFYLPDQKCSSVAKEKHKLFDNIPDFLMGFFYLLLFYVMFLSHDVIVFPDEDIFQEKQKMIQKSSLIDASKFGIIADDGKDDAKALNRLIENADDGADILLPQGIIDLYFPVKISRSNITLQGEAKEKTIIVSHLKTEAKNAISIVGKPLKRVGNVSQRVKYGDSVLSANISKKERLKWIKLREPNDSKFLRELGSKVWHRKYPYLRQEITSVGSYKNNLLFLNNSLTTPFDANVTEVYALKMIENVTLKDFTITQKVPKHHIQESVGVYQNIFKEYIVNMIALHYVANGNIQDIKILSAGSHALVFENVFGCSAQNLYINGSWNKGNKGNGYIRFSHAFSSKITDSIVKNMRHLTIQWSSANNIFKNLQMGVDINLHGGYAHDNTIKNIVFNIPSFHKWDGITLTPPNARWAAPDGPRNFAENIRYKEN